MKGFSVEVEERWCLMFHTLKSEHRESPGSLCDWLRPAAPTGFVIRHLRLLALPPSQLRTQRVCVCGRMAVIKELEGERSLTHTPCPFSESACGFMCLYK